MHSLIIFLPLFSSICTGFWGYKIGTKGTAFVTFFSLVLAVCISMYVMWVFSFTLSPMYISLGNWFEVETLSIKWSLAFDGLTLMMCVLVTLVSTLVYLYVWLGMLNNYHQLKNK